MARDRDYGRGRAYWQIFPPAASAFAFASKRKICNSLFFSSEANLKILPTPQPSSSHCSSVQERLVTYGSEALDTAEHLGLILGSQKGLESFF